MNRFELAHRLDGPKGLMLHCGGHLKSREEVFAVPLPKQTKSYVPLPYESLVIRVEKQLKTEGIEIVDERLALANDGQRFFGLMQLHLPTSSQREYGCVLGLRNSYDKTCSTGICVGATVFVCDNLSFRGSQITYLRKHTANLLRDLSWIITQTVSSLPKVFEEQSSIFNRYRQTILTEKAVHDLIIRFYDNHAVSVTEIPSLLKEWRAPAHSEFTVDGKSAWRLFNAATETIKGDLWRLPQRTAIIHDILDAECEVKLESSEGAAFLEAPFN